MLNRQLRRKQQLKSVNSEIKPTTQHGVLIRAIMAVPVAVTQEVGTSAVSVIALKLADPAVVSWAGGGLVRTVSAVPLAVTLPPYRNTSMKVQSKRHDAQY